MKKNKHYFIYILCFFMFISLIAAIISSSSTQASADYFFGDNYNYAYIFEGRLKQGKCQASRVYNNGMVLVKIDDITYLTSAENVVLIHKPEK